MRCGRQRAAKGGRERRAGTRRSGAGRDGAGCVGALRSGARLANYWAVARRPPPLLYFARASSPGPDLPALVTLVSSLCFSVSILVAHSAGIRLTGCACPRPPPPASPFRALVLKGVAATEALSAKNALLWLPSSSSSSNSSSSSSNGDHGTNALLGLAVATAGASASCAAAPPGPGSAGVARSRRAAVDLGQLRGGAED